MAFHPDDSGLISPEERKKREAAAKDKPAPGKGLLAAFMPGDQEALADQLSFGFGGTPLANMRYLSQTYSPMKPFPLRFGVGSGNRVNPQMVGGRMPTGGIVINGTDPRGHTSPPGRNF